MKQRAGNSCEYKVNFKAAVEQCRRYLKGADITSGELLERIARQVIPVRPGRAGQRKLRSKGFAGCTCRVAA